MENQKQQAAAWFQNLQADLCAKLEALEPNGAVFETTEWQRGKHDEDQGGGTMAMLRGDIIEKAGVHFSEVYGEFSPEFRKNVQGAEENPAFWASGISVIVHPRNPHAPTAHMNTRMVVTTQNWFGGGGDITPMLDRARHQDHPDTRDFHAHLKRACDKHHPDYYAKFTAECDSYFFLPHRNETRGTGGIFYDHLNSGDWDADFAFTQDVGRAFCEVYPQIIARQCDVAFSEDDRHEQMRRRGRYVEFNLLYDRGTMFGLKTGGNVDSILSSMPPLVMWP